MISLQSTLQQFEPFHEYSQEEIENAIKASSKKETVICRSGDCFLKFEGKRGNCSSNVVDVKILVKKPPSEEGPKMTDDERLSLFKEWYEQNQRIPTPNEHFGFLNVDQFYRKFYKNKQFVEKISTVLGQI